MSRTKIEHKTNNNPPTSFLQDDDDKIPKAPHPRRAPKITAAAPAAMRLMNNTDDDYEISLMMSTSPMINDLPHDQSGAEKTGLEMMTKTYQNHRKEEVKEADGKTKREAGLKSSFRLAPYDHLNQGEERSDGDGAEETGEEMQKKKETALVVKEGKALAFEAVNNEHQQPDDRKKLKEEKETTWKRGIKEYRKGEEKMGRQKGVSVHSPQLNSLGFPVSNRRRPSDNMPPSSGFQRRHGHGGVRFTKNSPTSGKLFPSTRNPAGQLGLATRRSRYPRRKPQHFNDHNNNHVVNIINNEIRSSIWQQQSSNSNSKVHKSIVTSSQSPRLGSTKNYTTVQLQRNFAAGASAGAAAPNARRTSVRPLPPRPHGERDHQGKSGTVVNNNNNNNRRRNKSRELDRSSGNGVYDHLRKEEYKSTVAAAGAAAAVGNKRTSTGRLQAYYRLVWEDEQRKHAPPEDYSDSEGGGEGGRGPTAGEEELATKMLQIQSKRFYLDVKQNWRGRFIKIAEVGAGGRKSRLLMSMSAAAEFRDHLQEFGDFYADLGPPNPQNVPDDGQLKCAVMVKENRRYYLDLKENNRGRFLRVTQSIFNGPRSLVVIPAAGIGEFGDMLAELLREFARPSDLAGFQGELPEAKQLRAENKMFYFDIGQNNRGIFMRISEVKSTFRTAITIPERSWGKFRDIFNEICDQMSDQSNRPPPMKSSGSPGDETDDDDDDDDDGGDVRDDDNHGGDDVGVGGGGGFDGGAVSEEERVEQKKPIN